VRATLAIPACPSAADLGRAGTAHASAGQAVENRYAEWHKRYGQRLKRKYQAGARRPKTVR
jgi:hypothetical protein